MVIDHQNCDYEEIYAHGVTTRMDKKLQRTPLSSMEHSRPDAQQVLSQQAHPKIKFRQNKPFNHRQ